MSHPIRGHVLCPLIVAALSLLAGSAASAEDRAGQDSAGDAAAVVPFIGIASHPSGDVPLLGGFGGEFGVGLRVSRITARIMLGSSFHSIKDGGNLVLGDSVTVASNWEFSWFGVDGQYALRNKHRGKPFLSFGIGGAYITRGENDNVRGWRISAGAGYEYSLHRVVSASVQAEVAQFRLGKAKAAGQSFDLAEPFDETVVSVKIGVNLFQRM